MIRLFAFSTASLLLLASFGAALDSERMANADSERTHHDTPITFAHDIAPIVYGKCASCHHAGEVAPFPFLSYPDVARRADQIAIVTQSQYMPPWKAEPVTGGFVGERRLTTHQIALFDKWAAEGAPEGNPHQMPNPPTYVSGWQHGAPDAIFEPKASYTVDADGADVYRCFVIPTNLPTDRYLSSVEVRPGNHRIVHHVILYLDTSGAARQLAGSDPSGSYTSFGGPGFSPMGSLGGWAPGMDPISMPTGTGILLPKGADIVLQVHYHKDGKPETDLTKIGLTFAKYPVDKQLRIMGIADLDLKIPAGDSNYTASGIRLVRRNITVLGVMPHMHLLGKDMTVTAALPTGARVPMVSVPNWDFNWQTIYMYRDPLHIPAGSEVSLVAHYDNSPANLRNPNIPPKQVTWGEQTTDEMCIAFVFYTFDDEHLLQSAAVPNSAGISNIDAN